mmetsp:Transcript_8719/g.21962  ORF Transcript_8719/g.21962 Transcript_8719/m.21962 type:complete len:408 (-) Transcript_8719:380-1603(-)
MRRSSASRARCVLSSSARSIFSLSSALTVSRLNACWRSRALASSTRSSAFSCLDITLCVSSFSVLSANATTCASSCSCSNINFSCRATNAASDSWEHFSRLMSFSTPLAVRLSASSFSFTARFTTFSSAAVLLRSNSLMRTFICSSNFPCAVMRRLSNFSFFSAMCVNASAFLAASASARRAFSASTASYFLRVSSSAARAMSSVCFRHASSFSRLTRSASSRAFFATLARRSSSARSVSCTRKRSAASVRWLSSSSRTSSTCCCAFSYAARARSAAAAWMALVRSACFMLFFWLFSPAANWMRCSSADDSSIFSRCFSVRAAARCASITLFSDARSAIDLPLPSGSTISMCERLLPPPGTNAGTCSLSDATLSLCATRLRRRSCRMDSWCSKDIFTRSAGTPGDLK